METEIYNKKEIIISEILIPSLNRLYQIDFDNIKFGVSERNICARLAHHMENIMHEYDVMNSENLFSNYYADVEYNRMGNGDHKYYENREHQQQYMVSDLLIHNRGQERNLLAVELKRKGNKQNTRKDQERLRSMVSLSTLNSPSRCVHNTLVGAFIEYSPDSIKIDIYTNGGCKVKVDNIYLRIKR